MELKEDCPRTGFVVWGKPPIGALNLFHKENRCWEALLRSFVLKMSGFWTPASELGIGGLCTRLPSGNQVDGLSLALNMTRTEGYSGRVIRMLCQLVGDFSVERASVKIDMKN